MNTRETTILVVDDHPANLNVLFDIFQPLDYDVLFASDGETCLEIAERERPDLIILDVMMPGIDGFETCRRLKARDATREIPVIFMTALVETLDKVRGFEVGGVDYITKPIYPEEVLARVKTHISLHQMHQMLLDREMHLRHLVEEKTRQIENMTLALVNALENANLLNDEETGVHIKRVGAYSVFLAERYGCDFEFVKRLKLYAPLHDVGKIGLPRQLLQKPGRYTDDEFLQMQQHVIFGAVLLNSDGIDEMAKNIALYHHEKWNGGGYVHHLAGEAIPLEARIVAVVDVYDALINERVYKKALTEDDADAYIRKESGKHFDPRLSEIFLNHKREILDIRQSFE